MTANNPLTRTEINAVAEYLRLRSEPAKAKDVVIATKGLVKWPNHPLEKLKRIAELDDRIDRPARGFYQYVDPSSRRLEERATQPPLFAADKVKPSAATVPPTLDVPKASEVQPDTKNLRVGDVLTCMVTGIEDYGVFVECPQYGVSGLIHKSKIKANKMFFNRQEIERHFKYGDWVRAKIHSYRMNGKIALTTEGFDLPDYSNATPIAEQILKVSESMDKFEQKPTPSDKPQEPVSSPVLYSQTFTPNNQVKSNGGYAEPVREANVTNTITSTKDELEDLYEMVRKKVGVLSPSARDALRDVVRKNGIVKVTMALITGTNDFEADVSLAFIRHLESKVNGGL